MTLLEVMVVTVLMALVASATMVSLGSADQTAQSIAVIGQFQDADIRGRLLAQTSGGSATLTLDEHRVTLTTAEAEVINSFDVGGTSLQIQTTEPVQQIHFDRFGHSPDYTIIVRTSSGERRWQVFGRTGVFREAESSP